MSPQVAPVLSSTSNGTTIVMVTHSPAYAEYSHRIVHLFDGKIVTENIDRRFSGV